MDLVSFTLYHFFSSFLTLETLSPHSLSDVQMLCGHPNLYTCHFLSLELKAHIKTNLCHLANT